MSLAARLKRKLHPRPPSKGEKEVAFWRERATSEGVLQDGVLQDVAMANDHYERAYTKHFELDRAFFAGKRIIDLGCGPRGSLEWATEAAQRVGVDPLVPRYQDLGIDRHQMCYIHAPAESIPVGDASFDVVCTMNSLDHVDDVQQTIGEITRIAAPGAVLLLMVEVCHPPTPTEPHWLDWSITDDFRGWTLDWSKRNGMDDTHMLYDMLDADVPYSGDGPGILRARMTKRAGA